MKVTTPLHLALLPMVGGIVFACGAGGPNEIAFAQQYYGIAKTSATRLVTKLNDLPRYKYDESLSPEDIAYLTSIGISKEGSKEK